MLFIENRNQTSRLYSICEDGLKLMYLRSTHVPQNGKSETITDKMRNEASKKKAIKNNA